MTSSIVTSLNLDQKMSYQTKNSCAKAFGNWLRNKNLRPKKSRGVRLTSPPPLCLLGLNLSDSSLWFVTDNLFTFKEVTVVFPDFLEVSSLIVCQVLLESPLFLFSKTTRHMNSFLPRASRILTAK